MGMQKIFWSMLKFLNEITAYYGILDSNEIIKSLCDNGDCMPINGNNVRQLFPVRAEVKDLPHHYFYCHCSLIRS